MYFSGLLDLFLDEDDLVEVPVDFVKTSDELPLWITIIRENGNVISVERYQFFL